MALIVNHALAFLHTSPAHVATFSTLLEELAPGICAHHVVAAALLDDAAALGLDHPGLRSRVAKAVQEAAASGARLVVCTCSTIAALAEAEGRHGPAPVLRIDRPMAEQAVRTGTHVRVIAAIESTLRPTLALLRETSLAAGTNATIDSVLVETAWPHYLAGRQQDYLACIREVIAAHSPQCDVLVLAQASMAPAAAGWRGRTPVLASPETGLAAALAGIGIQPQGRHRHAPALPAAKGG